MELQRIWVVDAVPGSRQRERQSFALDGIQRLRQHLRRAPRDVGEQCRRRLSQSNEVVAAVQRRSEDDVAMFEALKRALEVGERKIGTVGTNNDGAAAGCLQQTLERDRQPVS